MKKILFLLMVIIGMSVQAQEKKGVPFNGLITDASGNPIKKAKVYVKDPKIFTFSDKQGRFGLTDVKPDDVVTIVYKKTQYTISVEGKKSLRIRLGDMVQSNEDEELISYGYGYVKRREYTNAGSVLTGEALVKEGYATVMEAIRGRIPGLNVSGNTGIGGNATANIRGINSIYGSSEPLYLLDDVEVSSFDGVNLNDVERIEVIKDANIYGARGANGVIRVSTKKGGK
ncbi:MAG: TonB-dependent receptor plug domain-containing protein [Bacteroidaceae bacterium]|nr:TonB-dependent receptor plug domain-containing protein [Bacteroidaceae bacterium]